MMWALVAHGNEWVQQVREGNPHQISDGIWDLNVLKSHEAAFTLVISCNAARHNNMTAQMTHASQL